MPLLILWIQSFCQSADSVKCYTRIQLQAIVTTILDGKEAEAQLKVCDQVTAAQDSVITYQKSIISTHKNIILVKDDIISDKNVIISDQEKVIKRSNRKIKFIKLCWTTTSILLGATIIYFAIF